MTTFKKRNELTAINGLNVLLGLLLFVAPWMIGFQALPDAVSWNAWISGLVLAVLALAAIAALQEWEEWISLVVGVWIAISPWILGFAGSNDVLWTHLGIGLVAVVLAGVELWLTLRTPTLRAA